MPWEGTHRVTAQPSTPFPATHRLLPLLTCESCFGMTEEPARSFHRKKTARHTNKHSRENAVRLRFNRNKISNSTAAEVGAVVVLELENDDHEVLRAVLLWCLWQGRCVRVLQYWWFQCSSRELFSWVCARDWRPQTTTAVDLTKIKIGIWSFQPFQAL